MWMLVIFASLLAGSSLAHPSHQLDAAVGAVEQEQAEAAMEELELAEQLEEMDHSTRESRGLLKKVAFLAGMRVGGMVQSSGTLAASNSLRIFGKVVNSALSVSYGSIDDFQPIPGIEERPGVVEVPMKHHEQHHDQPAVQEAATVRVVSIQEAPVLMKETESEAQLQRRIKANFLANHNNLVERANSNSKFLRVSREKYLGPNDSQ